MRLPRPTVQGTFAALTLALPASQAGAASLKSLVFPPVVPLAQNAKIDGRLNEWSGVSAVGVLPIDTEWLMTTNDEAKGHASAQTERQLREWSANPRSAQVRLAYDPTALMAAVEWKSNTPLQNTATEAGSWSSSGDGLEWHFRVAGKPVLHLAAWPSANGLNLMLRREGEAQWQEASALGITAQFQPNAGNKGGVMEFRVPWSALGTNGKPPQEGSLEVAADFAWSGIGGPWIKSLPDILRRNETHFSFNLLTSRENVASQGYLNIPQKWGTLAFGDDKPQAAQLVPAALGTGVTKMTARRTATKPALDGSLQGWNESDFITGSYASDFVGARYSVKVATLWDDENLYIAAQFRAPGAPFNTATEKSLAGYAGGDALQVRLSDGRKNINITGWWDNENKKPALAADAKNLDNPFLFTKGAKEAFRTRADGYVQEIAIPWTALGLEKPQAGSQWQATFQPWWAGLDGRFTILGNALLQPPAALTVDYEIPREGNVSLGIYAPDGKLLRWLLKDERRPAGKQREGWDGLDQRGNALVPGSYKIKGILHDTLGTTAKISLGNPGTPAWPTPDGKGDWLSDEAAPQAVVTDGKWVFVAAPGAEKGFSIMALDENGKKQWGRKEEIYSRCVSMAINGDYIYAVYSGPEATDATKRYNNNRQNPNAIGRDILICLDKKTGKAARFTIDNPKLRSHTWPYREDVHFLWDLRTKKSFTPASYGGQPRYFADDVGESTNALGIASIGDKVFISLNYEDKILVLDAVTGQKTGEIPVAKPVGLAPGPNGSLLVVSGKSVLTLNPATGATAPLVTTNLVAPHTVTTDKAGNIYVSDWAESFQVKAFDSKGKFLRAIGKAGGRPWTGPWQPDGMLVPRGVAVTDAGKLWVCEDDLNPSRISVWNAATGAYERDYLGPAAYGGSPPFWLEKDNPNRGFMMGTTFEADWNKGTWKPLGQPIRRFSRNQPFASSLNTNVGAPGARFFTREGKRFVAVNAYHMVIFYRIDGEGANQRMTPVSALGGLSRLTTNDGTGKRVWDSDIGGHTYNDWYPDFFKGHAGDNFAWSDLNGDGEVSADEMLWIPTLGRGDNFTPDKQPEWMSFWGAGIGPDWSVYYGGFSRDKHALYRVDVQRWTPSGAPVYDLKTAKTLRISEDKESVLGMYVNNENKLFVCGQYEWGANAARDAISCYSRDGEYLWGVALPFNKETKSLQQGPKDVLAEGIVGEYNIPGIGNVLSAWLWHGNFWPYYFTSDGVYLGTVLEETRIGPHARWDESFKFSYQAPDGTPYLINGANDAYHVLELTGLKGAQRFQTNLNLTTEQVEAAANARKSPKAVAVATKPLIGIHWQSAKVDGDLSDWNLNSGVQLDGTGRDNGKGKSAKIALSRDAQNLYLAAEVKGATFRNGGDNLQTLFISGDAVDVMLSTGKAAKEAHFSPMEGDQRLMFSLLNGQPVAVLYRPVVPGTKTPVQLMAARIDRIVKLDAAKISVQRGDNSYRLEASVPLAELGISSTETGSLRGDVGVVFADETGTNRSLRLYHYNAKTQMTADLTTEATLQPGEWGEIRFPLGINLVKNAGFESPLAANVDEGWTVADPQNGGTAQVATGDALVGNGTLLFEQTKPIEYPATAYALPTYDDFQKTANNGAGGGYVTVSQRVPVVPGKSYTVRINYRSEGLFLEKKNPGAERGYASFSPQLHWQGNISKEQPRIIWIGNEQQDPAGWKPLLNHRAMYTPLPTPYTAPEGATHAVITLRMVTKVANRTPKIWVDAVEMVETTG